MVGMPLWACWNLSHINHPAVALPVSFSVQESPPAINHFDFALTQNPVQSPLNTPPKTPMFTWG